MTFLPWLKGVALRETGLEISCRPKVSKLLSAHTIDPSRLRSLPRKRITYAPKFRWNNPLHTNRDCSVNDVDLSIKRPGSNGQYQSILSRECLAEEFGRILALDDVLVWDSLDCGC